MSETSSWLVHDHRRYEAMLGQIEERAELEDWSAVRATFERLRREIELHIEMENQVLYPAYETLPATPPEPTAALRREHDEIARLLRDVAHVLDLSSSDLFLEALAALDRAMTQHHKSEEEIFLPMAGHALLARKEDVLRRLAEFDPQSGDPRDPPPRR